MTAFFLRASIVCIVLLTAILTITGIINPAQTYDMTMTRFTGLYGLMSIIVYIAVHFIDNDEYTIKEVYYLLSKKTSYWREDNNYDTRYKNYFRYSCLQK